MEIHHQHTLTISGRNCPSSLRKLLLLVMIERHGEVLHMPIAISVQHLREIIAEWLSEMFPNEEKSIPSEEWIWLQFWPINPYGHSALRHTRRLNVKHVVQI